MARYRHPNRHRKCGKRERRHKKPLKRKVSPKAPCEKKLPVPPRGDFRDGHHLVPECRGGGKKKQNMLRIWRSRHRAYHALFGNLTWEEAIELMQRVARAKRNQA